MHGEGDTLRRHETILNETAKRQGLRVLETYREIVSGETISARPQMQKLLTDVENGMWDGVLVMEVERLARGDTTDQGIVARTFKFSGTLIITPMKTYDPDNEYDEEYFEFGLFMSRREFRTINRRLQSGRQSSVREGKYVGNVPPYGYVREKLKNDKGYTLVPDETKAGIVRRIFSLYCLGVGSSEIARSLNESFLLSPGGKSWTSQSVLSVIKNPVYKGEVTWNKRRVVKKSLGGKIVKCRPKNACPTVCEGLHESIVSDTIFEEAQKRRQSFSNIPKRDFSKVRNSLAGLVKCSCCGRSMARRQAGGNLKKSVIICPTIGCECVSADFESVENAVISAVLEVTKGRTMEKQPDFDGAEYKKSVLAEIAMQIEKTKNKQQRLCELLETGVYSPELFTQRKTEADLRLALLTEKYNETENSCEPVVKSGSGGLLSEDAAEKNHALKQLLKRIDYKKTVKGKAAPVELTLYLKQTADL